MLSFTHFWDEVGDIHNISIITNKDLQNEPVGCLISKTYKKTSITKKGRLMVSACYYWVMLDLYFENLKVFFKIVVGLDEDDINLDLKQYNSKLTS